MREGEGEAVASGVVSSAAHPEFASHRAIPTGFVTGDLRSTSHEHGHCSGFLRQSDSHPSARAQWGTGVKDSKDRNP